MKRSSMLVAVAEVVRDDVERDLVQVTLEAVAIERLEPIVRARDRRARRAACAPTRSARSRCRRSPCRGCSTRRPARRRPAGSRTSRPRTSARTRRRATRLPPIERQRTLSASANGASIIASSSIGLPRDDHRAVRRERRRACGDGIRRRRRARPKRVARSVASDEGEWCLHGMPHQSKFRAKPPEMPEWSISRAW